jgi:uncharacterized membrane protein YeaQ/YmgE (transglycosylase-associated protein family)
MLRNRVDPVDLSDARPRLGEAVTTESYDGGPDQGDRIAEPITSALVIPRSSPDRLNIPSDVAIDLLDGRLRIGSSISDIRRRGLFGSAISRSTARDNAILQWHEENASIIEEMFDLSRVDRPAGAPIYREELDELLDSEIRQLSALREGLAVRGQMYPASGSPGGAGPAGPAGPPGPAGPAAASADFGGHEAPPVSVPRKALGETEAPAEVQATDEPADAAPEPADESELRSVAIAKAASAALPTYDADAASTRDFIGIDAVADAFSYLLASRNAQPPLAIGLFGEWGSGKSFLMQTIRRRIDEITRGARQSSLPQAELGVYKRVVQVEFNAWHYVEGNLWASLVDHIFDHLRVTPHESSDQLKTRREEITAKLASTTEQREDLDEQIATLKTRRAKTEQEATGLRERQLERLQDLQHLKLSDVAAAATLTDDDKKTLDDALDRVGLKQAEDTAVAAVQSLSEARTLLHRSGALLAPLRGKGHWGWMVAIIVTICAAPAAAILLQQWDVSTAPKVLTSLAASASGAVIIFKQGTSWMSSALSGIEAAEAKVRKTVDEEAKHQAEDIAKLEQQISEDDRQLSEAWAQRQKADEKIAELQKKKSELTPGKILAEFLDQRATSLDYQKHLGLTALIRKDFERLTTLVEENIRQTETNGSSPNTAADFSRVVLFVDDLDRCPPHRVVEVLQAVHLLLSFPVFAVVVAVDPRWLSRSLEMQYKGLIEARSSDVDTSTAQDYLEKIFQIPFRVAPLDAWSRAAFMSGLVSKVIGGSTAHAPRTPAGQLTPSLADPSPEPGEAEAQGSGPGADDAARQTNSVDEAPPIRTVHLYPDRDDESREVDLNPSSLQLDDDEVMFLGDLLPILDSSPRGLKRYINIYRLIKAVAPEPATSNAAEAQRRMFLLAMITSLPYGSDLIAYIIDSPTPSKETVGDRITEYFTKTTNGDSTRPESKTLITWLEQQTPIATCPVLDALDDARHVRLYSFA